MRSVAVLLGALLLLPLASVSAQDEPHDDIGITLLRIDDSFVHVTWTAAPGALTYALYRGATLDDLELVTSTSRLEYVDGSVPDSDIWYVVLSRPPIASHLDGPGPMSGKCLTMRGITGFSVSLAHCMPWRVG